MARDRRKRIVRVVGLDLWQELLFIAVVLASISAFLYFLVWLETSLDRPRRVGPLPARTPDRSGQFVASQSTYPPHGR